MAVAFEHPSSQEGVEVEEYVCKSSRRLQESVDDTRLAQEAQTEGDNKCSMFSVSKGFYTHKDWFGSNPQPS